MESEHTFVAPEGVYKIPDAPIYHRRAHPYDEAASHSRSWSAFGWWKGLLERKEKGLASTATRKLKEDGVSLSSGEMPEGVTLPDMGGMQDASSVFTGPEHKEVA